MRVAFRAQNGTYADGTLRGVSIEGQLDAGPAPVPGELSLLEVATPQNAWSNLSPDTLTALLPTSPAYLLGTGLFGKTRSVANTLSPLYEAQFVVNADRFWANDGADWSLQNYYDRVDNHYVYWARSGDPKWFFRANAIARDYRHRYLEGNNYLPAPHWMQMEGMAMHYRLTGDDSSAAAVGIVAAKMTSVFTPTYTAAGEGRITARMMLVTLKAWELNDNRQAWGPLLENFLDRALASQLSDGSYAWPNWCGAQANYMAGLLNDAYIKYYEQYKADPRIPDALRKSIRYMWTQWSPLGGGFRYAAKSCADLPEADAGQIAPDLNGLILAGYAFMAQYDGSLTFLSQADEIFNQMIQKAWLNGSKQFNQSYYYTHTYMGYR